MINTEERSLDESGDTDEIENVGQLSGVSFNQEGPCHLSSLDKRILGKAPRLAKSAGLSPIGTCRHLLERIMS